jgi:GNAT superfamily N-acetyltransferase
MSTLHSEYISLVGARSGLRYEHLRPEWARGLRALELKAFPTADPDGLTDLDDIAGMARVFPEGCFVGLDVDEPVAMGLGVRRHFDLDRPQHRLADLFDGELGTAHHKDGNWYYGIDIAVDPRHRRRGVGTELYALRKQVCRELGLEGIVAGGVLPGYADHKHHMSADEYIAAVRTGELYDPTLTFQIENGFEAQCALADYYPDPAVNDHAALIVWRNPDLRN